MRVCLSCSTATDIRDRRERSSRFLPRVGCSTYDARSNENLLDDLARAEGTALWNYTPPPGLEGAVSVMAKDASSWRCRKSFAPGAGRGVVVGASANKLAHEARGRALHGGAGPAPWRRARAQAGQTQVSRRASATRR